MKNLKNSKKISEVKRIEGLWQQLLDQPNIALGWNDTTTLALQTEDSIFESKAVSEGPQIEKGKLRSYFVFTPYKKESFVPQTCDKLYAVINETAAELGCQVEGVKTRKGFSLVSVLVPFEVAADQFAGTVLEKLAKGKNRILRRHYFVTNAAMPNDSQIREYMILVQKNHY